MLMKGSTEDIGRLRGILKGLDVDIAECETILSEARRSLARIIE